MSYVGFGDFRSISSILTAEKCQNECADDKECKIWEWVDMNAYFNPPRDQTGQINDLGKCYLKNGKEQGQIRTAVERVT